jgi:ferredoxin
MAKPKSYIRHMQENDDLSYVQHAGYCMHCVLCDRLFFSKRIDARYCSGACRQRAYRRRVRMARRARAMADMLRQIGSKLQ